MSIKITYVKHKHSFSKFLMVVGQKEKPIVTLKKKRVKITLFKLKIKGLNYKFTKLED